MREPCDINSAISPEKAKRLGSARYQRVLRAAQRQREKDKQVENQRVIREGNINIMELLKSIAELQAKVAVKRLQLSNTRYRYEELWKYAQRKPGMEWVVKIDPAQDVYPGPQQPDYQVFYETLVNGGFDKC
jgi:pyruvate-formate lyase-activating enzyme